MHIQYADRLSAQRAVSMSGQQIRETLIVGVRPIDPAHKMRVASYMQRHEVPASPLDHGVYVKPELSRPMVRPPQCLGKCFAGEG